MGCNVETAVALVLEDDSFEKAQNAKTKYVLNNCTLRIDKKYSVFSRHQL